MGNYNVILYKNKQKYKVIKNSKYYLPSYRAFKKYFKNPRAYFPILFDSQGNMVKFELALTGFYGKAEISKRTKSGHFIKKIANYEFEETIKFKNKGHTVFLYEIRDLLFNDFNFKVCCISNNKLFISFSSSDTVLLYTLKNKLDSQRAYNILKRECILKNVGNILFLDSMTRDYRKKLYEKVENYLNVDRDYLVKTQTS
jgi:hypothetical protein